MTMAVIDHLAEEDYIAFLCGEMQLAVQNDVQQHLNSCQTCTGDFQIYRHILGGLQAIFQKQGKRVLPAQLHVLLLAEAEKEKIYFSRCLFPGFFSIAAARTHRGIVKIFLGEIDLFKLDEKLGQLFPGKWLIHSDEKLDELFDQLKEYFSGKRTTFDIAIDKSLIKGDFQQKVLAELMHIKFGEFTTYGELSRRIHQPRASRAVGNALGRNPLPIIIPCHRILAGNRQLGGFTGGIEIKKELLHLENIDHASLDRQMSLF